MHEPKAASSLTAKFGSMDTLIKRRKQRHQFYRTPALEEERGEARGLTSANDDSYNKGGGFEQKRRRGGESSICHDAIHDSMTIEKVFKIE